MSFPTALVCKQEHGSWTGNCFSPMTDREMRRARPGIIAATPCFGASLHAFRNKFVRQLRQTLTVHGFIELNNATFWVRLSSILPLLNVHTTQRRLWASNMPKSLSHTWIVRKTSASNLSLLLSSGIQTTSRTRYAYQEAPTPPRSSISLGRILNNNPSD